VTGLRPVRGVAPVASSASAVRGPWGVDRADDPVSRSSVVEAYFDGTERDSVLGTYSITEEGETTLDAPLAAYRVEEGEVLPAR
jgi:hypothetical protein